MSKVCRKCGNVFLGVQCKPCKNAAESAKYQAAPEKRSAKNAAYYAANKDKVRAYQAANEQKIKAGAADYREVNKSKIKTKDAAYYAANSAKRNEQAALYRMENSEKVYGICAAYRLKNADKARAAATAWRFANPDARRTQHQNRRAQKLISGGSLSRNLIGKLFAIQKGMCPCCKQPLGDNYHMDHIMPLKLGGLNADENMQLLRAKCNLQKSAKHPVDFMQSRGFLL